MELHICHLQGWVPIAMICTFSRMAEALGLKKGTKQEAVGKGMLQDVAEALKDCISLQLSEDGVKVKRAKARELTSQHA